jgi:hypothetical protein
MGNGVTRRLLEREYPVVAFSRTPAKVESLRLYGAIISPSLRDLAGRVAAIAVTAAPLLWPRCYYVASCGIRLVGSIVASSSIIVVAGQFQGWHDHT